MKPALLSNSNYGHYLRYSDSTPSCIICSAYMHICNHGLTIPLPHLSRMERDTLQKSISIFRWISLDRFFATQPFGVAPCAGLFQMRQQEAGVDMFFFIGIDMLKKLKIVILTLSGRRRSGAEQIPISHRPRSVSVRGGGASGLGWKYEVQLLNSCSCQSFLFYNIFYISYHIISFSSMYFSPPANPDIRSTTGMKT